MTQRSFFKKNRLILTGLFLALTVAALFFFRVPLWENAEWAWRFFSDRDKVAAFIDSFGVAAPAVFLALQTLQVIFAPIPGEASGFIGGFVFGSVNGFLYSSIGLAAGSLINFLIGRRLGRPWVEKFMTPVRIQKIDAMVKRQGVIVIFLMFVFPGFPKDYLCLFLGVTSLPLKVFVILASVGRMPGTLMLSIQGEFFYKKMYGPLFWLTGVCVLVGVAAYLNRERLYAWAEKLNGK